MPTLAGLLNSPTDFEFQGKTYKLRQPTLIECGQYQRWLEQEARAGAARATELSDEDRRNLLRDVQADIASQRYAYGGELCVRSLQTPSGIAKMLAIVCADQSMTERAAKAAVDQRMTEIAALIVGELGNDPEGKALAPLLRSLGLAPNFFAASSPGSSTTPTAEASANSGASASGSSPPSSSTPPATSTGSPS